jgi:hypothetical protein
MANPIPLVLPRAAGFSKKAITKFAGKALATGVHIISDASGWVYCRNGRRLHPYRGQDRRRSGSGEKSALQMDQHRPWPHQDRQDGNQ